MTWLASLDWPLSAAAIADLGGRPRSTQAVISQLKTERGGKGGFEWRRLPSFCHSRWCEEEGLEEVAQQMMCASDPASRAPLSGRVRLGVRDSRLKHLRKDHDEAQFYRGVARRDEAPKL